MHLKKLKGYIERVYRFSCSDSIEIERFHSGRYGAPNEKRQKRRKPTSEEVARQNQVNRKNRTRRYLKENFIAEEDLWLTFTYKKGTRTDIQSVKRDFKRFIRWLKYQYGIRGHPLKWIAAFHVGSKGAGHFHMVLNRIPDYDIIVRELWKRIENSGHVNMEILRTEGDFEQLAAYIVETKKANAEGQQASEYSHSRNLVLPQPRKREIKSKSMLDVPRPYKGYYVDPESIVSGRNPITGHLYQHFTMHKLKDVRDG